MDSIESSEHSLDVHSWLVVCTFMIVIILVIRPQKRRTKYPYHITLNIATAPVLGVLFLLATQSIDGESVRNGIVGEPESGVEPYAVMILFFSLAYICISLDMTGVLQYAAFVISKRGGGGGQRIFLYFFLLSTIMSGLTSNDVVILTMTPFLVYFSRAVDLVTPVAFLMAEVQTANIASMALYIGNLTNVVACQAYGVSFLEYSAWMLLPTFASIAACYVMLRINFRKEKYIPKTIKSPDVDPRSCLVDPFGAIFGLAVLSSSLICLIGTSFAHVSVWIVTGPFALLTLTRDIWHDYRGNFKGPMMASSNEKQDSTGSVSKDRPEEISIPVSSDDAPAQQSILSPRPTTTTGARTPKHPRRRTIKHAINRFEHRWPLLYAIIIRMPWAILPFTFSMFIMVEGLSNSGWIAIFAGWATNLIPNYIVATYAVGFISVLLCNLFNNVPMTILVARILQHPRFVGSPLATPEVVRGCLFGLIVGSNLGACTTLISSLAGLMWDSVLRSKKSNVGFWGFFRWNMGVMPMVIFIALSVVVIELKVIYK
ncbi:arsenical pump membrane protein-domain-containing protein [Gamsiella multidivaricata]|uniref:arsenical pump membrane protein-domain-containing protein n=1 Tax=Gamsiella multidivaricata TaxID=101098 RepID=UPI002220647F|nr:arsenical pump membrane protein-domain-containing protein [Gamsiella multidivaricata]KAI7829696.1 arsenical pump membrane protein-domain-containing protein [Gamsiella multidivaricata]